MKWRRRSSSNEAPTLQSPYRTPLPVFDDSPAAPQSKPSELDLCISTVVIHSAIHSAAVLRFPASRALLDVAYGVLGPIKVILRSHRLCIGIEAFSTFATGVTDQRRRTGFATISSALMVRADTPLHLYHRAISALA